MKETVTGYVDILYITESKLGNSFPTAQFQINEFSSPYWLDRNVNEIPLHVREEYYYMLEEIFL